MGVKRKQRGAKFKGQIEIRRLLMRDWGKFGGKITMATDVVPIKPRTVPSRASQ